MIRKRVIIMPGKTVHKVESPEGRSRCRSVEGELHKKVEYANEFSSLSDTVEPCPLCGGTAANDDLVLCTNKTDHEICIVFCITCKLTAQDFKLGVVEAIAHWNQSVRVYKGVKHVEPSR